MPQPRDPIRKFKTAMTMTKPALLTLCLAAAVAVVPATTGLSPIDAVSHAAPQPDPVPQRWQLRLRPGPLRIMTVRDDSGQSKPYAYFTYDVINLTGEEQTLIPSFELATDEGHLLRSGRDVPTEVTQTILERLKNPFLEDERSIRGPIQPGRENAKSGLVIWPLPTTSADEIVIYAEGFSGETASVERPDTGESIVLRKTKMLRHATPGDIRTDSDRPLRRIEDRWIMR